MFGSKAREIAHLDDLLAQAYRDISALLRELEGFDARNERLRQAYDNMHRRFLALHEEPEPSIVRPYVTWLEPPMADWERELLEGGAG